jgi:hypothetical protein
MVERTGGPGNLDGGLDRRQVMEAVDANTGRN